MPSILHSLILPPFNAFNSSFIRFLHSMPSILHSLIHSMSSSHAFNSSFIQCLQFFIHSMHSILPSNSSFIRFRKNRRHWMRRIENIECIIQRLQFFVYSFFIQCLQFFLHSLPSFFKCVDPGRNDFTIDRKCFLPSPNSIWLFLSSIWSDLEIETTIFHFSGSDHHFFISPSRSHARRFRQEIHKTIWFLAVKKFSILECAGVYNLLFIRSTRSQYWNLVRRTSESNSLISIKKEDEWKRVKILWMRTSKLKSCDLSKLKFHEWEE